MPVPALPAASVTPVLAKVMTFVASLTLAVGVSVAVQVVPPSADATAVRVPLAIVRSALSKPVTASENVIVTRDVSPIVRLLSATTMPAVGRTPSIA